MPPLEPPSGAPGPEHLAHVDDRLLWLLSRAADEWGALGVALAAAHMTDPATVVARLRQIPIGVADRLAPEPMDPHEACEMQADALRAEVARLDGLLDQASRELDACRRQQARQAATIAGHPSVDADPRRPHLDSWPDDAVLLRYRELRDLVALHLDRYAEGDAARAMREGDVPLRLAEVLDRA